MAIHRRIGQRKLVSRENRRLAAQREALIEQLEVKNAELERYAYTVSHDLKSPLFTIKSFLGLVERDLEAGDSGRVRADLAHVAGAADQMARLLDDLLELSRIGRVLQPAEPVCLGTLAEEAVAPKRRRGGVLGPRQRHRHRGPLPG